VIKRDNEAAPGPGLPDALLFQPCAVTAPLLADVAEVENLHYLQVHP
jgi:hypothetical protein